MAEAIPKRADHSPAGLVRELTGDLPCVRCGYNLRGLSVRGNCPECGTRIRATILARVDPRAREFEPIDRPRLTGLAVLLWPASAFAAALCAWAMRLEELAFGGKPWPGADYLGIAVPVLAGLSGLSALGWVRPHGRIPAWWRGAALGAVAAYVPLCAALWHIHVTGISVGPSPYANREDLDVRHTWLRLAVAACMILILLGLRFNARLLVSRSMLMRTGRVDRQTMLAMVAAVGVGAIGDSMHLLAAHPRAPVADGAFLVGTMLIVLSSLLLTLGMAASTIDAWRIRRVIVSPPVTLGDLISGGLDRERSE